MAAVQVLEHAVLVAVIVPLVPRPVLQLQLPGRMRHVLHIQLVVLAVQSLVAGQALVLALVQPMVVDQAVHNAS